MMRRRRRSTAFWLLLSLGVTIALGLATSATPAHADNCGWKGGTGNWNDAINWSCGVVPDADDAVTINSGTAILTSDVTVQAYTQSNFSILQGDANITISGLTTWKGGTIQGAGNFNANGGLVIDGGGIRYLYTRTLNNPATATLADGAIWLYNGVTINNSGTWDVQTDENMQHKSGDYSTFNNTGTFQKTAGDGTTDVEMNFNNNGGTVDVQTGTLALGRQGNPTAGTSTAGVFTVASGATLDFMGGTYTLDASSSIGGAGTVDFSDGTATINCPYNVSGTTRVSGGTANFEIHPTSVGSLLEVSAGSANFNVAGTLNVPSVTMTGGTLNLTPDLNATTYTQSGFSYLRGNNTTVTVSGLTTWNGGTIQDAGTFNANSGLAIGTGGSKYLNTRTLNNPSTATWTGGSIGLHNGATINNSGTWDVQTDNYMDYASGGYSTFNNTGTFQKTAGSGTTWVEMNFQNTGGTVDVQTGTLALGRHGYPTAGVSTAGTFGVSSGATLDFVGGTHTFDASSSIGGAGTVDFSSGTATINCLYSVSGTTRVSGGTANFEILPTSVGSLLEVSAGNANFNVAGTLNVPTVYLWNSGTLNLTPDLNVTTYNQTGFSYLKGSSTVTVGGLTTWSGGTMQDAGTFNANGGMTINSGAKYLNTRTLNNSDTATWTGGTIRLYYGATINNSGTWDVQTNDLLRQSAGALSTINNTGIFKKTAGSGITGIQMLFNNDGNLDVQVGALMFNYDLTNNSGGVVEIYKGADLTVEGTLTNDGTMKQTLDVDGSGAVEFLHITNSGSTDKYRGVIVDTSGDMEDTTVSVHGNQNCPNASDGTVNRCYDIEPTTSQTADVTFYYLDSEANSNTVPDVYHWDDTGGSWDKQTFDARDTSGDPNWVRASGITGYSPFALSDLNPTAVELVMFVATPQGGAILLQWETASELDTLGFSLYRSDTGDPGSFVRLNEKLIPSQAPGSPLGATYEWVDAGVEAGQAYFYLLEDVDVYGQATLHGPVSARLQPTALFQIYLPFVNR